ncbi:MAG: response regulator transcription factor [Bacteroidetes bacterium]|nr:response regulator transcription factor [Bacteroidota bacterium]
MKRYNTIIIDDERNIREALSALIEKDCPNIKVCGTAGSAAEGRELLEEYNIDFIFLDISMPEEDGFEFLASIPKDNYGIIFITAYNEYAIRALKINAIDYLLKPIDPVELKEAILKATKLLSMRKNNASVQEAYNESFRLFEEHLHSTGKKVKRITVMEQFGFKIINVDELIYLRADCNYTELHILNTKPVIATKNLGEFERMLDNPEFFRIHKSILVNVNFIRGFSNYQGYFAELKDGTVLSVSRRRIGEFREWLKSSTRAAD